MARYEAISLGQVANLYKNGTVILSLSKDRAEMPPAMLRQAQDDSLYF
jgi:hypothetical protein